MNKKPLTIKQSAALEKARQLFADWRKTKIARVRHSKRFGCGPFNFEANKVKRGRHKKIVENAKEPHPKDILSVGMIAKRFLEFCSLLHKKYEPLMLNDIHRNGGFYLHFDGSTRAIYP